MERIVFTPETEVYIMNMHNPNKPLHGYIRDVITIKNYDDSIHYHNYCVRFTDDDINLIGKKVSLKYILYAKCKDVWYTVKDIITGAETYCDPYKPLLVGKYCAPVQHTPCVRDMSYEFEHDNDDCEKNNRAYYIKEEKIMESNSSVANSLEPGIMILYYFPESLKTYIGYIRHKEYKYGEHSASKRGYKLYYLVTGARVAESVSIVPEQILAYMSGDTWIDADTLLPSHIFDILENFNSRYHLSKDKIKENINSVYGKTADYAIIDRRYYKIPTFDLSSSYICNHKNDYFSTPSPSERLKKKLKRIEVNGDYMTAVWYDRPATVIKLSENDMYDTEKAYMWLLLKGLCENNKSECDRVLKLMEDITFEKK